MSQKVRKAPVHPKFFWILVSYLAWRKNILLNLWINLAKRNHKYYTCLAKMGQKKFLGLSEYIYIFVIIYYSHGLYIWLYSSVIE